MAKEGEECLDVAAASTSPAAAMFDVGAPGLRAPAMIYNHPKMQKKREKGKRFDGDEHATEPQKGAAGEFISWQLR